MTPLEQAEEKVNDGKRRLARLWWSELVGASLSSSPSWSLQLP